MKNANSNYSAIINAIHTHNDYLTIASDVVSDIIGLKVRAFEVPCFNDEAVLVCFLDKNDRNSLTVAIRADGGVEYFTDKWYDEPYTEMQEIIKEQFIWRVTI